jgi:hypothetical protein
VYRPVIAGRPASSAYAIPWGTRSAVRTSPATRSLESQLRRYDESRRTPGATERSNFPICIRPLLLVTPPFVEACRIRGECHYADGSLSLSSSAWGDPAQAFSRRAAS